MTRLLTPSAITAALAAAALVPASATAASWTSSRAATSSGSSAQPAVTLGEDSSLAVGYVRRGSGQRRVEVRRGTVRGLLRRGAIVVDRASGVLAEPALAPPLPDGRMPMAWSRIPGGAAQVTGTTIDPLGTFPAPQPLAPPDGHGLAHPTFAAGADGSFTLVWTTDHGHERAANRRRRIRPGVPDPRPRGTGAA
jgi:hypothetical protein